MENTLYHGQPLRNLLNMAAGDKHVVDKIENCYPMIPSGKAHNQMLLGEKDEKDEISEEGKVLV